MMTPECSLVLLLLAFSWFEGIAAAAYSNVVVQRGPLDYINYNAPALTFDTPLAQLTAGSLEQLVSLPVSSIVSPCVSPCVIPNTPLPTLGTVPSTNAKIIAYKTALVPPADDAIGYTYAYAVFDDQTGDKKTQSEHSDGSVVQGQYSFIQPDGIRRIVVYSADDLKGFNAVVKNISPETEHPKGETSDLSKDAANITPPCTEVQNERLTNIDSSEEVHAVVENLDNKKNKEKNADKNEIDSIEAQHNKEANQSNAEAPPAGKSADDNTNIPNALISYNDIINCLQAKLRGAKNVVSPLTYVLIPTSKSPC